MEIWKVHVIGDEKGALRAQVDTSRVRGKRDCPERFVVKSAGIVVVGLVVEVNLTHVEIESKERERASVASIVLADVQPLHDTHIDGEQHPKVFTGNSVGTGALSKNARLSYQPIEIPHLRWLISRTSGKEMDEDAEWRHNPAWDGSRFSAPARQSPSR